MIRSKLNLSDKIVSVLLAFLVFFASITIVLTVGGDTNAANNENEQLFYAAVELHYTDTKGIDHLVNKGGVVNYKIVRDNNPDSIIASGNAKTNENGQASISVEKNVIPGEGVSVQLIITSVEYYGYTYKDTDKLLKLTKGAVISIELSRKKIIPLTAKIVDENGEPLDKADIAVKHTTTPTGIAYVQEMTDGVFSRNIYVNENYDITIKTDDYQTKVIKDISVADSSAKKYDLGEIKLERKLDDPNIKFLTSAQQVEYIDVNNNSSFSNELLKSKDNDGKITYSVTFNGAATQAEYKDNTLDFSDYGPGQYIVTADVKDSSKYYDRQAVFVLNVVDTNFKFEYNSIDVAVTKGEIPLQKILGQYDPKFIKYTLSDSTGQYAELSGDKIILKKVGKVTVNACYKNFPSLQTSYVLNITHYQTTVSFDNKTVNVTYGDNDNQYNANPLKINDDELSDEEKNDVLSDVRYSVVSQTDSAKNPVDSGVVEVDERTGELTIRGAGKAEISASLSGSEKYDAQVVTYKISILKANQDTLPYEKINFEVKNSDTITFSSEKSELTYTNKLIDNSGIKGTVTYEITSGSDIATINSKTGTLTINKAGKITVQATKTAEEKNNYNNSTRKYTLTVNKGTPDFKYEVKEQNIHYGNDVIFAQAPTLSTEMKENEQPDITYSFTNLTNSPVNSIDAVTGKIQMNDKEPTGRFRVTATLSETDKYNETSASYTVNVSYAEETAYTKTETDYENWYNTSNGVIFKADSGYKISADNSFADTNWTESEYKYNTIKKNQTVVFYLRNDATKEISRVEVGNINIDCTVPTNLTIDYAEPQKSFMQQINEYLFFGLFNSQEDKIDVIITANDNISDIKKFGYSYILDDAGIKFNDVKEEQGTITEDKITSLGDGKYQATFSVPAEFKGKVSFTATNGAGLTTEFSGKDIIVDNAAPKAAIEFETEPAFIKDGVKYLKPIENKRTIDVTFKVWENNFSEENTNVVINNKIIDNLQWRLKTDDSQSNGDNYYTASTSLNLRAEYTIQLSSADIGGQFDSSLVVTETINTDTKAPSTADMSITYTEPANSWITNVLKTLTFNAYKDNVTVTFKAKDDLSGIAKFNWEYLREEGASEKNKDILKDEVAPSEPDNDGYQTASITITADQYYRGSFSFTATDVAGNESDEKTDNDTVIVVDEVSPDIKVEFSEAKRVIEADSNDDVLDYDYQSDNDSKIIYYDNNAVITFNVNEVNFYPEDVKITVTNLETDEIKNITPESGEWTGTDDNWRFSHTVTDEGKYQINMEVENRISEKDVNGNPEIVTYQSNVFVIDKTNPIIQLSYSKNGIKGQEGNIDYFSAQKEVEIKITEHNFRASEVTPIITTTDVTGTETDIGNEVTNNMIARLHDANNWENVAGSDVYIAKVTLNQESIYSFQVEYQDLAARTASKSLSQKIAIDKTPPKNIKIEYPQENYFEKIWNILMFTSNDKIKVTVTAEDNIAKISSITLNYKRENRAYNQNVEDKELPPNNIRYSNNGKTATAEFEFSGNQYRGSLEATVSNLAGLSDKTNDEGKNTIIVDTITPTSKVSYTGETRATDSQTLADVNLTDRSNIGSNVNLYYNNTSNKPVVTFDIDESNFDINQAKAVITVNGNKLANSDIVWNNPDTESNSHWTSALNLSSKDDGDYQISLTYTDPADNAMQEYHSPSIRIDRIAPKIKVEHTSNSIANNGSYFAADRTAKITITEHNFRADLVDINITATDVSGNSVNLSKDFAAYLKKDSSWTNNGDEHIANITFSDNATYDYTIKCTDLANNSSTYRLDKQFTVDKNSPSNLKISYSRSLLDMIISTITFGYYQSGVIVTLSAEDNISGIDYVNWRYTKQLGTSSRNVDESSGIIRVGTDNLSSDKKTANVQFKLDNAQYRGNISFTAYDKAGNSNSTSDGNHIVVVDSIAPELNISYTSPVNVVGATSYYDESVTATFTIDEANFYSSDVQVEVERAHNGSTSYFNPAVNWNDGSGDQHIGTFTLFDEGEYFIRINYTDRSSNRMGSYLSNEIVIDHTNPVMRVSYSPNRAVATNQGYNYYSEVQTATITIVEHNFQASDVAAAVKAVDVTDKAVSVTDYGAYLRNSGSWSRNGDVYTATITFNADANYTLNLSYRDLANRSAGSYSNSFTVDKTPPKNLKIEYPNTVNKEGFYKNSIQIKISADDDTTPINRFSILASNQVNADEKFDITTNIKRNGYTNTVTFNIPKNALTASNQFRGTIGFTAKDTANNETTLKDKKVVVVDSIAPNANISFNEPVSTVGKDQYYASAVNGTIAITETNFYSEDVKVTLNKLNAGSGSQNSSLSVKWDSSTGEKHTGTFSVKDDGEYIISVEYTDRSGNKMETYESNKIIIDTTPPTLEVEGLTHHSASNSKTVGFKINSKDDHFDKSAFKAVLTAIVKTNSGEMQTKNIDLSKYLKQESSTSYSYVIDNLPDDAVYTLNCSSTDLSGNSTSKMSSSDGKNYDKLEFSVNRNGSTFSANASTQTLISNRRVTSVNNDIVIEEINASPITFKSLVIKNGNTEIELKQGVDFEVEINNSNSEWSTAKYTIKKSVFDEEGNYSVSINSEDASGKSSYSDTSGLQVNFTVDKTPPTISVSGIEDGGRYQVGEQKATVIITEGDGGLSVLDITVLDSSGSPIKDSSGKDISVRFHKTETNLNEYLSEHNSKVEFTVPEGLENQVVIYCADNAVNAEGKHNETTKTITGITVSMNNWIIFYANKPLFYGCIIGGMLLIIAVGFTIAVIVRRKKSKS